VRENLRRARVVVRDEDEFATENSHYTHSQTVKT